MTISRIIVALTACLTMTACGSIPQKDFEFRAIDINGSSQTCLVVVNGDFEAAIQNESLIGKDGTESCSVTIPFTSNEVEVTIVPCKIGMDLPRSRAQATDYKSYTRRLRLTDPGTHLFILERKRR